MPTVAAIPALAPDYETNSQLQSGVSALHSGLCLPAPLFHIS
jgi:hypothetical protein